jgi:hypothetical protein
VHRIFMAMILGGVALAWWWPAWPACRAGAGAGGAIAADAGFEVRHVEVRGSSG